MVVSLIISQHIRQKMHSLATRKLLSRLTAVFPALQDHSRKGENGRIAVIGGSFEFTGAPYYSAISALRTGGDLSHIFCSKFSSPAIKSYSPEIIVHPVFVSQEELACTPQEVGPMLDEWVGKIKDWEKAIHSWIIGPGLGRDRYMQEFFPRLVRSLPDDCLVIFDADGIYYLCHHPQLFDELARFRAILTPNYRELAFLQRYFHLDLDSLNNPPSCQEEISEISPNKSLKNFKILIKGEQDIILGSDRSFIVRTEGGKKRCGGMGDILAGVTAACGLWDYQYGPALASRIVRQATKAAYEKEGRGMTAPCVIKELANSVKKMESQQL